MGGHQFEGMDQHAAVVTKQGALLIDLLRRDLTRGVRRRLSKRDRACRCWAMRCRRSACAIFKPRVVRDSAFGDDDAEHLQFAMNARCTSQGIGNNRPLDEPGNLDG